MVEIVASIKKRLLNIVFPIECFSCGSYGSWWCEPCQDRVVFLTDRTCLGCDRPSTNGETCPQCLKSGYPIDGFLSVSHYNDPLVKEAIHYCKYESVAALAKPLGSFVAALFEQSNLGEYWWHAVAVPLHPRRERLRGFNQSVLIADELTTRLGIERLDAVERSRWTHPQRELSGVIRRTNLNKAFTVTQASLVIGKNILIVDDVATTGSTFREIAQVLKDAGALKVWGLAAAHG